MKNLILTSLLFISTFAFAQKQDLKNNFFIDGSDIYWQYITDAELSFDDLLYSIMQSGNYEDIAVMESMIVCNLKPFEIDYKSYGYRSFSTPVFITQNLITASVIFEYKDLRVRTTIKKIQFISNFTTADFKQGFIQSFESWFLNDQKQLKFDYFNKGSDLIDKDFKAKTTFTELPDRDW